MTSLEMRLGRWNYFKTTHVKISSSSSLFQCFPQANMFLDQPKTVGYPSAETKKDAATQDCEKHFMLYGPKDCFWCDQKDYSKTRCLDFGIYPLVMTNIAMV